MSTNSLQIQNLSAVGEPVDRNWRNALIAASTSFLLCILLANRTGFSLDEYQTLISSRLTWSEMIRDRVSNGFSPLPYLCFRIFANFGDSERVLRLGSALAIAASILAITQLALVLGLRRYLVPIWLLAIMQPYWLMMGTQYQHTALLILAAALASSSLIEHLKHLNAKTALQCTLMLGLLFWMHPSALCALPALLFFVLWDWYQEPERNKIVLWQKLRPVIGGFCIVIPLLVFLRNQSLPAKEGDSDGLIVVRRLLEACFSSDSLWHDTVLGRWPSFPISISYCTLFLEALLVLIAIGLAWKELGGQSSRACRFLLCLFLGIPVSQIFLFVIEPNYRVFVQYLAIASVPFLILAGIGWKAEAPLRWRVIFRVLVVLVIALQFSAACLYKGKYLRETARYLTQQAGTIGSLIISTDDVNRFALDRENFPYPEKIQPIERRNEDLNDVRQVVYSVTRKNSHGVILLFSTRAPVAEAILRLKKQKIILDYRQWDVTSDIKLMAWIRSESEKDWLRKMNPPILRGLMLVPESRP